MRDDGQGEATVEEAVRADWFEARRGPAVKRLRDAMRVQVLRKSLAPKKKKRKAPNGSLSSEKAETMLRDNSAQGHPLTARQKRYFGWVAGGRK